MIDGNLGNNLKMFKPSSTVSGVLDLKQLLSCPERGPVTFHAKNRDKLNGASDMEEVIIQDLG